MQRRTEQWYIMQGTRKKKVKDHSQKKQKGKEEKKTHGQNMHGEKHRSKASRSSVEHVICHAYLCDNVMSSENKHIRSSVLINTLVLSAIPLCYWDQVDSMVTMGHLLLKGLVREHVIVLAPEPLGPGPESEFGLVFGPGLEPEPVLAV